MNTISNKVKRLQRKLWNLIVRLFYMSIESINFYWIDIWEDTYAHPGELFLFGKVFNHVSKKHENCTIWFQNY